MEKPAVYGQGAIPDETLVPAEQWQAPTAEAVRAAMKLAGWTGEEFSRRVGVKGRTVRRWTSGEQEIPYAAWCMVCAEAGLGLIWK